jgi:hypothetical protein
LGYLQTTIQIKVLFDATLPQIWVEFIEDIFKIPSLQHIKFEKHSEENNMKQMSSESVNRFWITPIGSSHSLAPTNLYMHLSAAG